MAVTRSRSRAHKPAVVSKPVSDPNEPISFWTPDDPCRRCKGYSQLVVWPGTSAVGDQGVEEDIQKMFGLSHPVRSAGVVVTLPTPGEPGTGGRHDFMFLVHDADVPRFALPRLAAGIRWWEDVLSNGDGPLYPEEFTETYPVTW